MNSSWDLGLAVGGIYWHTTGPDCTLWLSINIIVISVVMYIMNTSILVVGITINCAPEKTVKFNWQEVMDLVYYSAFLPALSPPFHNITVTFGDKNCVTILPSDPLDVLFAKGRRRGGLGAKNTPCITETQQTLINPRNLICLCINFCFENDHSVSFEKRKLTEHCQFIRPLIF